MLNRFALGKESVAVDQLKESKSLKTDFYVLTKHLEKIKKYIDFWWKGMGTTPMKLCDIPLNQWEL